MKGFNRIVCLMLIVAGVACVVYGACYRSIDVSSDADGVTLTLAKSEPALTQEASVGGVTLDETDGKIKQTYTGESPKACAT